MKSRDYIQGLLNKHIETIESLDKFLDESAIGPNVNRQFGDASSNNIKGWLDAVSFNNKFLFKESLTMTLSQYEEHRNYNLINMRAVGTSYEAMFTAFVIMCAGREIYQAAYTLAASLYENVFLAGFKPERLATLEVVTKLSMGINKGVNGRGPEVIELVNYFVDVVNDLGFDLADNNYQLSAVELAKLYLSCCALTRVRKAKQNGKSIDSLSPVIQELAKPIMEYIPLVDLVRNVSRGNPDWDSNIPVEVINMAITSPIAHELFQESTLRRFLNQIYSSYNRLCKMTKMSLRVKASTEEEDIY